MLTYVGWENFGSGAIPVVNRIIGKVGMQLTMVDVSEVKDLPWGQ